MEQPLSFDSSATLDIPRARKALEHLRAHPEEHNQLIYGRHTACGTTMCIAGTVLAQEPTAEVVWSLEGFMFASNKDMREGYSGGVGDRAQELLRMNKHEADWLFSANNSNAVALNRLEQHIIDAERVQFGNSRE